MDLVPDHVLSLHVLPILSFRDALRLYSSGSRFRWLLSARMVPRLDVLWGGPELAIRGGFLDLVEFLVDERGFRSWNVGMCWAAEGGCLDVVEYFVGRGATAWNGGMACAASGGHWDLVEYFVGNGASGWNRGMANAASGGYPDLVEYFVRKGALDWNWGMRCAAKGGHPDLVGYFEQKMLIGKKSCEWEFEFV